MSITFISNVLESSTQEEIDRQCSTIWKVNPQTAIKLFFFIRDKNKGKNQERSFIKIMKWLYENDKSVFYKNFSLIVGIPNRHTYDMVESTKMLKSSHTKHQEILDYFIQKEHQDSFKENWNNTTKNKLLEAWSIPEYGDWKDLITLSNIIPDKKIFYITINLFSEQIRKDIKNKNYSNASKTIVRYPIYEEEVKKIIGKEYENVKKYKTVTKKEKQTLNFKERYAFISI